jgi:hypothetical protein
MIFFRSLCERGYALVELDDEDIEIHCRFRSAFVKWIRNASDDEKKVILSRDIFVCVDIFFLKLQIVIDIIL